MRRLAGWMVVLACLVPAQAAIAAAADGLDAKLREADRVRTSDPKQFVALLRDIEAAGSMSATQRERLDFLHGYQLARTGELQAAIAAFEGLRTRTSDPDLGFRAGAMLVNAYAITRDFRQGLMVAQDMVLDAEGVKDRESRHHGLLAIGVLYNQVGEHQLGATFAQRVLGDSPSARNACIGHNLRVESLLLGGTATDDTDARSALRRCEAIGDDTLAGFSRIYLARHWLAQGRTREAVRLVEANLADVEATGYKRLIGEVHSLLGELHNALGDVEPAERHARAAIGYNVALADSLPLVVAYRTLADIAERRGDLPAALALQKRFVAAERGHRDDVATREMAYQIVRHQSLQQAQQIELLNRQNEVLQLQQTVQQQSAQNSRLTIVLLVMLVGMVATWAYKTKRMQVSLRRMAQADALTGICNRRHFTARAEAALAGGLRDGEEIALVMFDLDHFKAINDRFGHAVGDWVLRSVVATCRPLCRGVDCFGRIGGEEFAILMVGCDERVARRLADDCRVRIAGIDTRESGYNFQVTASFGISTTRSSTHDLTRLLSHADKVLYSAKHAGRNQVAVYRPTAAMPLPVMLRTEGAELHVVREQQVDDPLPRAMAL